MWSDGKFVIGKTLITHSRDMFFNAMIFTGIFITSNSSFADVNSLCSESEMIVISFKETDSKKLTSVCKEKNSEYLVYRFGRNEKIELQYPRELNISSWKKFQFYGRRRAGGKANAGFGEYWLSFSNGPAEYVVSQEWSDEEETYVIGVNVKAKNKTIVFAGNRKSQQGSLVLLESEDKHIRNMALE